jgi:hypothetical protein
VSDGQLCKTNKKKWRQTLLSGEIRSGEARCVCLLIHVSVRIADDDQWPAMPTWREVWFVGHPYVFHVAPSSSLHVHSFLFFVLFLLIIIFS